MLLSLPTCEPRTLGTPAALGDHGALGCRSCDRGRGLAGLDRGFGRVVRAGGGPFPSGQPRRRGRACVRGPLAPIAGKQGWILAEVAGDPRRTGCSGCSTPRPGMPTRAGHVIRNRRWSGSPFEGEIPNRSLLQISCNKLRSFFHQSHVPPNVNSSRHLGHRGHPRDELMSTSASKPAVMPELRSPVAWQCSALPCRTRRHACNTTKASLHRLPLPVLVLAGLTPQNRRSREPLLGNATSPGRIQRCWSPQ
jgi:hypothetical protein